MYKQNPSHISFLTHNVAVKTIQFVLVVNYFNFMFLLSTEIPI